MAEGGDGAGDGPTFTRRTVGFVLAFFAGTMTAMAPQAPSVWWVWALVVLACMILAAILTVGADPVVDWLFTHLRPRPGSGLRSWLRSVLRLVLVPLSAFVVVSLAWFTIDGIRDFRRGCTPATEVSVVASPETLETARFLAEEYELVTARADEGCPGVNFSTYAAESSRVQKALQENWDVLDPGREGAEDFLRDLGPRPTVWMPDSTVDVDRLTASMQLRGGDPPISALIRVYGWSPLVLAVPSSQGPSPGQEQVSIPRAFTWQDALTAYEAAGFDVVTPSPGSSVIGQLSRVATYPRTRTGKPGSRQEARRIEALLGTRAERGGFPPGDTATILQHYRANWCAAPPRRTALILPYQFVLRPEFAGRQVSNDPTCPAAERSEQPEDIRPRDTPVLNHPFVQINWESADAPASRAATAFERWLFSDEGAAAVRAAGLEPGDRRPEEGRESGPGTTLDPALMDQVEQVLEHHSLVSRPLEILLAIDSSGSMQSRRDLGVAVLDATVERLSQNDRLALITFGGQRVRPLVAPGPAGAPTSPGSAQPEAGATVRDDVRVALTRIDPAGGTPLWRGIAAGVSIMTSDPGRAAAGPSPPIRSLVVVTDGQDTAKGPDPAISATRAHQQGIRIFAVAAGSADCSSETLQTITRLSGGRCIVAQDGAQAAADALAAAIWEMPVG